MPRGRIESFSDCVIAFAITLSSLVAVPPRPKLCLNVCQKLECAAVGYAL